MCDLTISIFSLCGSVKGSLPDLRPAVKYRGFCDITGDGAVMREAEESSGGGARGGLLSGRRSGRMIERVLMSG